MPRLLHLVVLVAVATLPAVAWGAEPMADMVEPGAVSQFARMIRWTGVFTSLFVILGAWIVLRVMNDFVERISQQFATRRLLLQKLATITQFVIYVGTGLTVIMLSFRIDERVLAVIGGTIAVSVGFAIKDLVASFIAGIMIMLDRPFQVGDRVSFGGEYGDITSIGLRSVRMQTLDDNTVTIPNNKFLSEITSNGNYGALDMQVAMTFDIGVDQDVTQAREIVTEAAVSSRFVHLPKPVVVHVGQLIHQNHVAMRLTLKAYVLDTKHEKNFQTDVNLRVFEAFRSQGVLPPAMLHRGIDPVSPA